jgi:hypothetical protein
LKLWRKRYWAAITVSWSAGATVAPVVAQSQPAPLGLQL